MCVFWFFGVYFFCDFFFWKLIGLFWICGFYFYFWVLFWLCFSMKCWKEILFEFVVYLVEFCDLNCGDGVFMYILFLMLLFLVILYCVFWLFCRWGFVGLEWYKYVYVGFWDDCMVFGIGVWGFVVEYIVDNFFSFIWVGEIFRLVEMFCMVFVKKLVVWMCDWLVLVSWYWKR